MVKVTVTLPPKLAAKLAADARRKGVSRAALVRAALEQVYRRVKVRGRGTVHDRAWHLMGSLKGGPHDLSTNKRRMEGFGAS